MSESSELPSEGQKPKAQWKNFFIIFFGLLFLLGGAIWVVSKIAVFIYDKTIGSSVDGFFADNSVENIIFWAWLIVAGLFIGNMLRNG